MLPDILGTIPGWITSGTLVAILGVLLRNQVQNRKLGIERVALDNSDTHNIRDHYAKEVQSLRASLHDQAIRFREDMDAMDRRYREALADSEKRHEECLADRDGLRNEVSILRSEIDGLVRVITQASIDRVVMLGDAVPPEIKAAAARAQAFIKKENER